MGWDAFQKVQPHVRNSYLWKRDRHVGEQLGGSFRMAVTVCVLFPRTPPRSCEAGEEQIPAGPQRSPSAPGSPPVLPRVASRGSCAAWLCGALGHLARVGSFPAALLSRASLSSFCLRKAARGPGAVCPCVATEEPLPAQLQFGTLLRWVFVQRFAAFLSPGVPHCSAGAKRRFLCLVQSPQLPACPVIPSSPRPGLHVLPHPAVALSTLPWDQARVQPR